MVQDALNVLAGVTRHLIGSAAFAVTLAFASGAFAQSAADHAGQRTDSRS